MSPFPEPRRGPFCLTAPRQSIIRYQSFWNLRNRHQFQYVNYFNQNTYNMYNINASASMILYFQYHHITVTWIVDIASHRARLLQVYAMNYYSYSVHSPGGYRIIMCVYQFERITIILTPRFKKGLATQTNENKLEIYAPKSFFTNWLTEESVSTFAVSHNLATLSGVWGDFLLNLNKVSNVFFVDTHYKWPWSVSQRYKQRRHSNPIQNVQQAVSNVVFATCQHRTELVLYHMIILLIIIWLV